MSSLDSTDPFVRKTLIVSTLILSALMIANGALAGSVHADASAWDAASWDGAQWDGAQWDGAQWDGSQWDASSWDASSWDASSWDASSWDASSWDASSWDAAQWDASNWDAGQWDAAQWDASNWDASNWDAAQWDAAQWDASNWDASNWDAAQWDTHHFTAYDPLYPFQWDLRAIGVPGAWLIHGPGNGSLTVCVLDSGIDYTHPDLAPQMWADPKTGAHGIDLVGKDNDPMDVAGHGTHVASIIGARSGDGYGIAGIANVKIMAVRILDKNGAGTDADLAAGMRYCVDHGAKILSLSLTVDDRSKDVQDALKYVNDKGALVVASGGNKACSANCPSPILHSKRTLVVTALGPDGKLAPFGSWSKRMDLAAPGIAIPGDYPGPTFMLGSGTSQAVPHATGVAALVWMANPALSADDVSDILTSTARDMGLGTGQHLMSLDAPAAVAQALRLAQEAKSK